MADEAVLAKANELVTLVTANANFLTRAKCYEKDLNAKDYEDWAKSVLQVTGAEPEATVQSRILASADFTNDKANIAIDPFNRYQIFTDIIWSTIGALSTGYAEDPKKDQYSSTCRGVRYSEVFLDGQALTTAFKKAFTVPPNLIGWLDVTDASQKLKDQQKALDDLVELQPIKTINGYKEVFSALFSTDEMTKLFFIENYLLDIKLGYPWGLMGYDPYLAYLSVYTGWLSNDGLNNRIVNETSLKYPIQQAAGNPSNFTKDMWTNHINTDDARANLAQQAIKFLEITGKWLQSQKTSENNKEFFTGWNNSFIVDPKCMVNMLVIVNELVNVANAASKYTLTPKVKAYQEALSLAYKQFEMEIGD